jgi:HTH-type transcriptional regulator/antitoxin HigA
MKWKVIKTEEEYNAASTRLMEIFQAETDTLEGNELELLILLVGDYDEQNYPF